MARADTAPELVRRKGSAWPDNAKRQSACPTSVDHRSARGAVELACSQDHGLGSGIDAATTAAGGCRRAGEQDGTDRLGLDGARHVLQSRSRRLAGAAGRELARAKEHDGKVGCTDGPG